jgi:hypothetical protein
MALGRSRFKKSSSTSSSDPFPLLIANWVLRFLQLVFACAVIGLYASDLRAAHKAHAYTDSKWAYAVAIAVLSAVTSLVYCVPMLKSYWAFGWDFVLL